MDIQTGKPYKNEDGTIYYYDPGKPAPGLVPPEAYPVKIERAQSPTTEKTPLMSPKHEVLTLHVCLAQYPEFCVVFAEKVALQVQI